MKKEIAKSWLKVPYSFKANMGAVELLLYLKSDGDAIAHGTLLVGEKTKVFTHTLTSTEKSMLIDWIVDTWSINILSRDTDPDLFRY